MNKTARIGLLFFFTVTTFFGIMLFLPPNGDKEQVVIVVPDSVVEHEVIPPKPTLLYGFIVDSLVVEEDRISKNQSLSDILLNHNISHKDIFSLASASKQVFDVRKIRVGSKYTLICEEDSAHTGIKMIYEPDPFSYIVFHLHDSLYSERVEREVKIVEKNLSGSIEASLSVTMDELGISQELTNEFVDVFAWKVDFFALQKGDRFKVVYREKHIDGEPVGIEGITAIQFEHWGNEYLAFEFDQGDGPDYFDKEGKSIRKALLRYPLKFSRISSRYSLSRFHPVQKRYKAHLGTDFAAATGTPIRAVGDGIIIEAGFKKYNGNYVKLKHNATYTTQYLHMSKIGKGIRSGVKVKQGQTIGYVGATGLATGSHLCYRFWKNGVQVDALRVEIPPSYPVSEENLEAFELRKKELKAKLDGIPYTTPPAETIASITN